MKYKQPITFIDVETTGTSPQYGKVIEVAAIRFQYPDIIDQFHTLVNPEMPLDPFICKLTGIEDHELEHAPTFSQIRDQLLLLLEDAVFAAHNVRFDYTFIKEELSRCGVKFEAKKLCTVKLAKALYPDMGKYNLDVLIDAFNIPCKNRHRAFDDANAICHFFKQSIKKFKSNDFQKALDTVMKKPALPPAIKESDITRLPEKPGVYMFYGQDGALLYVGKSTSIRDRVSSHFTAYQDSPKEFRLTEQVKSIEIIETGSELGALLLESQLVKEKMPIFNRQLRKSQEMIVLKKREDKEGFFTIKATTGIVDDTTEDIIGIFRSQKQMKETLFRLVQEHNLCPKLLGLEKTKGRCFYYGLGTCKGACAGKENALRYNMRFIQAFHKFKIKMWPFKGPIMIKERGTKRPFIVDHWKLIEEEKNGVFDFDTYKILTRYLLNPLNQKNISEYQNSNFQH